jgi:PKD repeat protein
MKTIISSAIVFFSIIFTAGAQNSFLSLSGQVTDIATGAPIQNHIVNAEVMGGGMVQYYDYYTNAQGYYGDSILTFFGVGTINVSTVDCNGEVQSYSGTFSPNNVYFVFDFSICTDSSGSGCQAKFAYFEMENGLVAFYDQSTGSPATGYPDHWQWEFGDGQTSYEQNPVHAYNGFGPYNVCLTVWDDEGFCQDTYCELVYLNGTGGDCLNWFTYETFNYLDYAFMGQSVPFPADYYYWDFGDGSYGTGQDVLHSYGPNTGDYVTVVLTTFSYDPATGDSCVAVSMQEIWLNGSGNDCANWFWYEQTNTSAINFHGESFPLPAMLYLWDFGDGQTATGQTVSHAYDPNSGDVFLVTLLTYSYFPGTADTCVANTTQ